MSTILSIDLLSTNPTMISFNTGDNNSISYPFISDFNSNASKVVSLDLFAIDF